MSYLNDIIDRVNKNERVIEDWLFLKNSYFRGENGFEDLKNWADKNGLIARERYIIEKSVSHKIFKSVEFIKKS